MASNPSDKLLLRISENLDPVRLRSVAVDVGVGDVKFSNIVADFPSNTGEQAFRVLSTWSKSTAVPTTQQVIDKVWDWKRKGWVDIDVMENIKDLVDTQTIDLKLSRPGARLLSNVHVDNISQRITRSSEVSEFGIKVLRVPQREIDKALQDNKNDIHAASHQVLLFWLRQQDNREQAYTLLHDSLQKNEYRAIAAELRDGLLD